MGISSVGWFVIQVALATLNILFGLHYQDIGNMTAVICHAFVAGVCMGFAIVIVYESWGQR